MKQLRVRIRKSPDRMLDEFLLYCEDDRSSEIDIVAEVTFKRLEAGEIIPDTAWLNSDTVGLELLADDLNDQLGQVSNKEKAAEQEIAKLKQDVADLTMQLERCKGRLSKTRSYMKQALGFMQSTCMDVFEED